MHDCYIKHSLLPAWQEVGQTSAVEKYKCCEGGSTNALESGDRRAIYNIYTHGLCAQLQFCTHTCYRICCFVAMATLSGRMLMWVIINRKQLVYFHISAWYSDSMVLSEGLLLLCVLPYAITYFSHISGFFLLHSVT